MTKQEGELWEDDLDRAYERICELEERLKDYAKIRLLSQRYAKIQHWYETADRSPQSWVELDKIMENQDD